MTKLRETRDGDLLRLELNDPGRANALSPELIGLLTEAYSRDLRSEGIRAVLLSGAGKHFSAGADLDHLRSLRDAGPEDNLADSQAMRGLFEAVLRQPTLTVAAVQGACVAGGCGLATAHDFVVAADDARFMYSEVRIGFVAALVATFLPLRLKGADIREVLLNPEFVGARKALDLGLVNRVVDAGEVRSVADSLAVEILERASSESIARTKALLLSVLGRPLEEALEVAARANADARGTEDCQQGIATFLDTKAPPRWR
ncbi:MAG: enoyl-CoA hydratase/isomerase family protein [Thermoanaerobaculia bacterium]